MPYFQYFITILFVDCLAITCLTYENITRLNLANSDLLMIKRETFNKYQKLEELNIINSRLNSIADGAFYDLPRLTKVNMSKNFISKLSEKIFRPGSKLRKFDVSHNMLTDINDFDIEYLPELAIFDISNNQIRYLPVNVVNKVKNDKNFTLIATNNPWDCTTEKWSAFLDNQLAHKFCESKITPQILAMTLPPQSGLSTCIFWIVGAFWCGIILGNLCVIRRIVCRPKLNKQDQCTQYDFSIFSFSENRIKTGPFSDIRMHTFNPPQAKSNSGLLSATDPKTSTLYV
ncbi:leucine-rich repeat-containing protein egg-6-like isoform X2 [Tribolium madens]|uniref:leucine-rich repeat-containing protein egg-6-like isoform X2 n=1 Tax=Tribolium madens TaxID=41895 RepID=UPI001CF75315|nr:leucine-rich repeat-containing protein egg-6-like isoform X2 [Tribolium madens]